MRGRSGSAPVASRVAFELRTTADGALVVVIANLSDLGAGPGFTANDATVTFTIDKSYLPFGKPVSGWMDGRTLEARRTGSSASDHDLRERRVVHVAAARDGASDAASRVILGARCESE